MIEHYCKIMNNVNVLLLEDKLWEKIY
jgi:hypothetical protein